MAAISETSTRAAPLSPGSSPACARTSLSAAVNAATSTVQGRAGFGGAPRNAST